jgi:hypothetical protein
MSLMPAHGGHESCEHTERRSPVPSRPAADSWRWADLINTIGCQNECGAHVRWRRAPFWRLERGACGRIEPCRQCMEATSAYRVL